VSFAHFAEAKITGAIAITYTPRHCELWNMDIVPIPKQSEFYLNPTKFADPIDSAVEPQTAKGTTTAAD
jgi:hypothetical protein